MAIQRKIKTIPAISANAALRAWYGRELQTIIDAAHNEIVQELATEFSNKAPASLIATDARTPAGLDRVLKAWASKWNARFDKLSVTLANKFVTKNFRITEAAVKRAFADAGFTVAFKPTRASMAAYRATVSENIQLIKSIPAQYLTGVQSAVWTSVTRGSDLGTLSKALQSQYGSTVKRAALIARDQNAKAKATIENTRRQQLGITHAIWQHSAAGKDPRPTHVAMDGKEFELKRGMYDSDEGTYVLPGQLINCRCTSRAIIPGLEDEA